VNSEGENIIDISIIIVNYNVKEFLANLLNSIYKAKNGYSLQIIVVDNASKDDSVPYLKNRYPDVTYFGNDKNLGFGKANNQAIKIAKGKYTLIINPDTLMREDTLTKMYLHMEQYPATGAAGCKLLNPDGTFALESRRSVPTPVSALWKVLGLTALFPKNKTFAEYYLNWMDEDKASRVPVLSGAFMFFRTSVLKELEGFDEQFFLYGEDIDICHRVNIAGYHIDYVPDTSIIHFKGESTKKDQIDYIVLFNKALFQFFKKHYSYSYSIFFRFVIFIGIILRGVIGYIKRLFFKGLFPVTEIAVINIIIIIAFLIRYKIPVSNPFSYYKISYFSYNLLITIIYLLAAKYYDLYSKNRDSILTVSKCVVIAFSGVAFITFFLRDFAFSRMILVGGALAAGLFLSTFRLIKKNIRTHSKYSRGQIKPVRLLIVGTGKDTDRLIKKIRGKVDWNYEIIGLIGDGSSDDNLVENVPVIGKTRELSSVIRKYDIDQVFFQINGITYNEIIQLITQVKVSDVIFKMVPDSLDFILGKSNVEYLDDIPLLDVSISYKTAWNIFIKRLMDIILSVISIFLTMPLLPFILIRKNKKQKIEIDEQVPFNVLRLFLPYQKHKWKNRHLLFWYILIGRISFVGAPLTTIHSAELSYKPGLTGLRQINESRVYREDEKERYELFYLQNYSIWLDFDILLKTLIGKTKPLLNLDVINH